MELIRDPEWQLAFDFVQYTGRHIFLTGRAGTGKTTFLHTLKKNAPKRMVVVAPTGVAAINAGGVTIHSFFQLPFGPMVPGAERREEPSGRGGAKKEAGVFNKVSREKINIIRSLDLLVIDEVSMVRADLLDAIDGVLRRYRHSQTPFGGVQLLMIGDLQQLAPVIRQEDWEILQPYYDTGFFFGSQALRKTSYITIELNRVFRQRDQDFIGLLNRVRDNRVDEHLLEALNSRVDRSFRPDDKDGYITLTTHNAQAKELNDRKLAELKGKTYVFSAEITGDFPAYAYPTDQELLLKEGAQVMFVKNDPSPEKRFYNGKIGRITEIGEEEILVHCEGEEEEISVTTLEWQNMKYTIDPESREIEEQQVGSFIQVPLRLAWAITIHKSQGLTFDRVIIDAQAAFAHGQVYVALSRCRTLGGLVLCTPVIRPGIISDQSVREFSEQVTASVPGPDDLDRARREYRASLLTGLFDFTALLAAVRRCRRVAMEHEAALTGQPVLFFKEMEERAETEIGNVARRFGDQLRQLLEAAGNDAHYEPLQERVRAAAAYFAEKCARLFGDTDPEERFDSDNKAVLKAFSLETGRLQDECREKLACLQACTEGFDTGRFLRARALAALEPVRAKKRGAKDRLPDAGPADARLAATLKSWRVALAKQSGIPAYMVLSVKAIEGIAAHRPMDYATLLKIKGIGKKKVQQYGREILEMVWLNAGRDPSVLGAAELPMEEKAAKRKSGKEKKAEEGGGKAGKGDSVELTYKLFREGMKPEEIAGVRNLVAGTVYAHLQKLVGEGRISAEEVLGEARTRSLERWFRAHPGVPLKEAKEQLGRDTGYEELRIVLAGMERK
ncbi:MAG: helix-turn-helix domain-containing protein [Bacteroidota bacterium]